MFSGLVHASSAVKGRIKYNNQMMLVCPFIVDGFDSAVHSSRRGMHIKPTWLLLAPWSDSLNACACFACRAQNEQEMWEACRSSNSWRELDLSVLISLRSARPYWGQTRSRCYSATDPPTYNARHLICLILSS